MTDATGSLPAPGAAAGTRPATAGRPSPRTGASARPKRRRRVSLATLFGLVFGGLIAVALALVLGLAVIANARNTLTLLNEKAVLLVTLLRTDATAALAPIEQTLRTVQDIFARSAADLGESNDSLVEGILAGAPNVKAFLLHDREFRPQGMIRDESGEFVHWVPGETETGVVIDTLKGLAPDDPPRWGVPVVVEGDTYLYAAAPLMRDGVLEGYAIAAIAGDLVFDRFETIARTYEVSPFLLYGDDRLIVGGTATAPDCETGCSALMPLDRVADPVLSRYSERRPTVGFGRALASGVDVSFVEGDGDIGDDGYVLVTEEV